MGVGAIDLQAWLVGLPHGVAALAPVRDHSGRVVEFRYDFLNDALARMLGIDRESAEGRLIGEVDVSAAVPAIIDRLARVADGAGPLVDTIRVRSGMVGVTATLIEDHVVIAVRDASEETRRNRALQQLVGTLESSSDFVAILDPTHDLDSRRIVDFRVRFVNGAALSRLRIDRDAAIGSRFLSHLPDFPEHLVAGIRQVATTGVPFVGEGIVGSQRFSGAIRLLASPFEDGVIISVRDTSAEALARAALAHSEAQFRATVEALREAIFVFSPVRDADGSIVDLQIELVNDAAVRMTRRDRHWLVHHTLGELLPDLPPHVLDQYVGVFETGRPRLVDASWMEGGELRTFEASVARSVDGIVAAVQDVTRRRQTAQRIADSERRYRLLADNAGDVVFLARPGSADWIAPSVEQLLGFRSDELLGTDVTLLAHPDDLPVLVDIIGRVRSDGIGGGRARFRRKDGTYVWVEARIRAIPDDDGGPHGAVVGTMWSAQAQVEAEQELARAAEARLEQEARIQQATRLESLGVMAGGIAHDFNNLLVGVLGNAEMALVSLEGARHAGSGDDPATATAAERIGRVVLAAQRAADLTRQLLDYAGRRNSEREPVDLAQLVADMRVLVAPRLAVGVELACIIGDGPYVVLGDRGQLQQVLMNLVINASDALAERGGRVAVTLDRLDVGGGVDTHGDELEPGPYVVLSVVDDGPGIPQEALGRVFEPFFTTRSSGRGLGLAVVHGVVRSHGGTIHVASSDGAGTSMTVQLPATALSPAVREAAPLGERAVTDDPVVLVIDDDEQVSEVSALVLRHAGMSPVVESDPIRAIKRFGAEPHRYAAVLLDLTMPEMSGDAVLAALRRIDPAIPVVLVSGYAAADLDGRLEHADVSAFVRKPFTADALASAVTAALRPASNPSPPSD